MITVLLCLVVFVLGGLCGFFIAAFTRQVEDVYAPSVELPPVIPEPVAVALPAPRVAVQPAPSPALITLRLLNERGRILGTAKIDSRMRRPTFKRLKHGAMEVFQASHHLPNNEWVYRRVGVERPS